MSLILLFKGAAGTSVYSEPIADALVAADTSASSSIRVFVASETATALDTPSNTVVAVASPADTISSSFQVSAAALRVESRSISTSLTEVANALSVIINSAADGLVGSDISISSGNWVNTLSDSLTASESTVAGLAYVASFLDVATISHQISAVLTLSSVFQDLPSLSDGSTSTFGAVAVAQDVLIQTSSQASQMTKVETLFSSLVGQDFSGATMLAAYISTDQSFLGEVSANSIDSFVSLSSEAVANDLVSSLVDMSEFANSAVVLLPQGFASLLMASSILDVIGTQDTLVTQLGVLASSAISLSDSHEHTSFCVEEILAQLGGVDSSVSTAAYSSTVYDDVVGMSAYQLLLATAGLFDEVVSDSLALGGYCEARSGFLPALSFQARNATFTHAGNSLLAIGGEIDGDASDTAHIFRPDKKVWMPLAKLPRPVKSCIVTTIGDIVIIAGTETSSNGLVLSTKLCFYGRLDGQTVRSWTEMALPVIPTSFFYNSTERKLYVIGGSFMDMYSIRFEPSGPSGTWAPA
jgi:hypothetical protein